jgi:hypothetical protein
MNSISVQDVLNYVPIAILWIVSVYVLLIFKAPGLLANVFAYSTWRRKVASAVVFVVFAIVLFSGFHSLLKGTSPFLRWPELPSAFLVWMPMILCSLCGASFMVGVGLICTDEEIRKRAKEHAEYVKSMRELNRKL